MPLIDLRVLFN